MVEIYQTEDEQVEAIKRWWRENGKSIIAGIVIGIAAVLGWNFWQDHRERKTARASEAFAQLLAAVEANQADAVRVQAELIKQEYGSGPYATLAALAVARLRAEEGKFGEAREQLLWAEAYAPNSSIADIARIRLARVWLAEGNPDEALAVMNNLSSDAFAAAAEEVRGDAYRMQGEFAAAREAYDKALGSGTDNRRVVEMKIADLGLPAEAGITQ